MLISTFNVTFQKSTNSEPLKKDHGHSNQPLKRKIESEPNLHQITSWPLVGNEGMNPQYTNVKVDSLIPY